MPDPRDEVIEAIDDGHLPAAERLLERLVAEEPYDPDAWLMLVLVRSDLGKGDGAREAAAELLRLTDGHPRAHWAAGVAAVTARRHDDALGHARSALEAGGTDPAVWALVARVHAEQAEWADSLRAAEEGLAADGEHLPSANYRALALRQLGRHAEADAAFAELATAAPLSAFSNAGYGWSLLRRGARADAEDSFREALRLDPASSWARTQRLWRIA